MSEVKRFRADHRHVVETEFDDAQYVRVNDYDSLMDENRILQKQLGECWGDISSLRESLEVATEELEVSSKECHNAKRNEHNSEVAYKSAIERQEELRNELAALREDLQKEALRTNDYCLKLTTAEQRNAILEAEIKKLTPWVKGVGSTKLHDHAYQLIASVPCEKCKGKGFIDFTDKDLRNENNGCWGRCLTCRPYEVSLTKPTESGASE